AGDQTGNVDEFDGGRHDLFRSHDAGERLQPRIGHAHHPGVRINGAEGIVLRGALRAGGGVEEGRSADVRQTDDAAADGHQALTVRLCSLVMARSAPCSTRIGTLSAAVLTVLSMRY